MLLSARQAVAAESVLCRPTRCSECMICRCRLLSSTTSWSTMPIRPAPAAVRYRAAGEPSPPAPMTSTELASKRACAARRGRAELHNFELFYAQKPADRKQPTLKTERGQEQLTAVARNLFRCHGMCWSLPALFTRRPCRHNRRLCFLYYLLKPASQPLIFSPQSGNFSLQIQPSV